MSAASLETITSLSATQIAQRIARRELSSAEAVEAHLERISEVNPALNAVVVPLYDEARQAAKAADEAVARGEPLGPLHGVPITIKEMFHVQGTPTTAGLTNRRTHRASRDAAMVSRLREAGAIIVGKTNVPQMGSMAETDNPIYGRTNNPWNLNRSPGGSSGGEAAIIAAGGSPLGLGSDGGGSIRQPCHSCGIHGLKPSARRLSFAGHWSIPNFSPDWVQPGPMARTVEDLWTALRLMHSPAGHAELDAPPTQLGDPADINVADLRIGMYCQLGEITAAPAVQRATQQAAAALRGMGAAVEAFQPPEPDAAWRIYMRMFYADGMRAMRQQAKDSQLDWRVKQLMRLGAMPSLLRPFLAHVFGWLGQARAARTLRIVSKRVLPTHQYFQVVGEQHVYRRRFIGELRDHGFDAIICPPNPLPAITHGELFANYSLLYTSLYNLMGLPAGVVAATRVREDEQTDRPSSRDAVDRSLARIDRDSVGLPVGVQVVGPWWREDIVLAVMSALETHFRGQSDYPSAPPI